MICQVTKRIFSVLCIVPCIVLASLFVAISAAHADDSVSVKFEEPTSSYNYYDPSGPIPPQVKPGMKGDTHWNFKFSDRVNFKKIDTTESATGTDLKIILNRMDVTLTLSIDTWLPQNAPEKLKEHEAGHKKIAEYFYTHASPVVEFAVKSLIGKEFKGQGKSIEEAQHNAVKAAGAALVPTMVGLSKIPLKLPLSSTT